MKYQMIYEVSTDDGLIDGVMSNGIKDNDDDDDFGNSVFTGKKINKNKKIKRKLKDDLSAIIPEDEVIIL